MVGVLGCLGGAAARGLVFSRPIASCPVVPTVAPRVAPPNAATPARSTTLDTCRQKRIKRHNATPTEPTIAARAAVDQTNIASMSANSQWSNSKWQSWQTRQAWKTSRIQLTPAPSSRRPVKKKSQPSAKKTDDFCRHSVANQRTVHRRPLSNLERVLKSSLSHWRVVSP